MSDGLSAPRDGHLPYLSPWPDLHLGMGPRGRLLLPWRQLQDVGQVTLVPTCVLTCKRAFLCLTHWWWWGPHTHLAHRKFPEREPLLN